MGATSPAPEPLAVQQLGPRTVEWRQCVGELDRIAAMALGMDLVRQRLAPREKGQAGAVGSRREPFPIAVEVTGHVVESLRAGGGLHRVGNSEHEQIVRLGTHVEDRTQRSVKCARRLAQTEVEQRKRSSRFAAHELRAAPRDQGLGPGGVRTCVLLVAADSVDRARSATLQVTREVSPLIAAVLILITVLVLTPLFKNLPEAVLAALIIHAVSHLWKVAEMRRYYSLQRLEFWLALATLLGVITIDVLPGLVIGVAAMLLLVIYHAARAQIGSLGRVPGEPGAYGEVGRHPDYDRITDMLVLRLEAPLFYAHATPVRDRIKTLVGASDPLPGALIIDLGGNERLDITSAEMLTDDRRSSRRPRRQI